MARIPLELKETRMMGTLHKHTDLLPQVAIHVDKYCPYGPSVNVLYILWETKLA